MNEKEYLTVSSLTKYIKYKFDIDNNLKNVFLKGEISNFKAHSTGHMYFSLKDEKSKINAIMFNFNAIMHEYEYWYEHRNSHIESVSICRAKIADERH
jgi:exodeoxyribonuclease VII large subunit